MLSALASALHIIGLTVGLTAAFIRISSLRDPFDDRQRQTLFSADNWSGLAAIVLVGAGLWRLFGDLEKGSDFYLSSPMFWVKMSLFGMAGALEILPMIAFLRWRIQEKKGEPVDTSARRWIRPVLTIQLSLYFLLIPAAAMMARGIGHSAAVAEGPCGVRALFVTRCAQCHDARTRLGGLDLVSDPHAALVGVASAQWVTETRVVAGDPEASLLFRKVTGRQGAERGTTMPLNGTIGPEGVAAIEAWIRGGAARCEE